MDLFPGIAAIDAVQQASDLDRHPDLASYPGVPDPRDTGVADTGRLGYPGGECRPGRPGVSAAVHASGPAAGQDRVGAERVDCECPDLPAGGRHSGEGIVFAAVSAAGDDVLAMLAVDGRPDHSGPRRGRGDRPGT